MHTRPPQSTPPLVTRPLDAADFAFFSARIRELTGIHLSDQKLNFVQLKITSRLNDLGLASFRAYRDYLAGLPPTHGEWQQLINRLTTNKTNFFREPTHFDYLVKDFLPKWEQRSPNQKLAVWSAVCSTGEEPYTIAMVLEKYFGGTDRFRILASDIDTQALAHASNGVYARELAKTIPEQYHRRALSFGVGESAAWFKINDKIHKTIQFQAHNLINKKKPIPGRFDIIFCRNVFIYFAAPTIEKIVNDLYEVAADNAALLIGHSESLQNLKQTWKYVAPSTFTKDTQLAPAKAQPADAAPRPHLADVKKIDSPAIKSAEPAVNRRVRVLIVDDSPTITRLLSKIFQSDPGIEVLREINRPREVESALRDLKPDVMTLDINMPDMDGCAVLRQVMGKYPVPTVMISSISMEEGPRVLEALELGAVDYIQKPMFDQIKTVAPLIIDKVRGAALAKVRRQSRAPTVARIKSKRQSTSWGGAIKVIAIGASTGGTEALKNVLVDLPYDMPPIVIVQHIPPVFSNAFATRLNDLCELDVREAKDGDVLRSGLALVAPGGIHMRIEPRGKDLIARLDDSPAVNRHKPSVDFLFDSVAQYIGAHAIGVILTGMGADGARGLLKMRQTGSKNIAQNEASCVVFGMPKEAIKLAAVEQVCGLDDIAGAILKLLGKNARASA